MLGILGGVAKTSEAVSGYRKEALPEPGHYRIVQFTKKPETVNRDYSGKDEKKVRSKWEPTIENSTRYGISKRFGKFYKHPDNTWWSPDLDGHGGSAFKVFVETPKD